MIIGRASATIKGLIVQPSLVDNDYTGEIILLAMAPFFPVQILPGQRIAQALPLPMNVQFPALSPERGATSPGSSEVFWVRAINQTRPKLVLTLQGRHFEGLIDSGADTTCIASTQWPPEWPTASSSDHISGVAGSVKKVLISAHKLVWQDEDRNVGLVRPYIIPDLPVNLWGRDIMEQVGAIILSCKNPAALQQMLNQGYTPTQGLGRELQGIAHPIDPAPNHGRLGLGFSSHSQNFPLWSLPLLHPRRTKLPGSTMIPSGWASGHLPVRN